MKNNHHTDPCLSILYIIIYFNLIISTSDLGTVVAQSHTNPNGQTSPNLAIQPPESCKAQCSFLVHSATTQCQPPPSTNELLQTLFKETTNSNNNNINNEQSKKSTEIFNKLAQDMSQCVCESVMNVKADQCLICLQNGFSSSSSAVAISELKNSCNAKNFGNVAQVLSIIYEVGWKSVLMNQSSSNNDSGNNKNDAVSFAYDSYLFFKSIITIGLSMMILL